MRLVKPQATPILIQVVSWFLALVAGGTIVYLVFNFGYYASGLASYKQEQRERLKQPIPLSFSDPNSPSPPADANSQPSPRS